VTATRVPEMPPVTSIPISATVAARCPTVIFGRVPTIATVPVKGELVTAT